MWTNKTKYGASAQTLAYGESVEVRAYYDSDARKWSTVATCWTYDRKLTGEGPWCEDVVLSAIAALGSIIEECEIRRYPWMGIDFAIQSIKGMVEVMK